ncbi:MAG TPA: hypothetical protein VJP85_14215 [Candidatus Baltobacteraceae bacterium]|nr:hypothetical protein [Candidatus Baltobacteraceae bacterium]
MEQRKERDLVGHPSDYGSRTLPGEDERLESEDIGRTADGEPREDRGTADSAISREDGGK